MGAIAKVRQLSLLLIGAAFLLQGRSLRAQSGDVPIGLPDPTWAGKRVVMLKSFGDYFSLGADGKTQLVQASGLSVNVVNVVDRVEGERVWINGTGNAGIGWLDRDNVILLDEAIPYFSEMIRRNPNDWDAYFRRAESEHALNQRQAAIDDYTAAIKLHPEEPFLYLRRGRSYRILQACDKALADFDEAIHLRPQWAELYSMEAGIYSECPDVHFRDLQKATSLIEHAIALDIQHPTYLTILASIYAQAGDLEKAVTTQKQAIESPLFPPGYRDGAIAALHKYEEALAAQKAKNH